MVFGLIFGKISWGGGGAGCPRFEILCNRPKKQTRLLHFTKLVEYAQGYLY